MSWLATIDTEVFRFINLKLAHPILDVLMPQLAGNRWFIPAAILLGLLLLWKGGLRGRLFVLVLLSAIALGDALVINTLKDAFGRLRPYHDIPDARVLVGYGGSGSMPSSHMSTWCAATLIAFVYYPWTRWFLVPFAALIGLSRIYVGVHYPSDVLVGAVLGAGYAAAFLALGQWVWQRAGRRYFPLWWEQLPRLILRPGEAAPPSVASPHRTLSDRRFLADQQWFRLAHVIIFVVLAARFFLLSSDRLDLSEDEAYQWVWSKHLALSYYSKPPMIALAHWFGTRLWGDTEFGVRFLPPVIATIIAILVARWMRRLIHGRAAFITVLILLATPLLAVGATVMTIDPLLVLFWTAAMISGWRAVQPDGTTAHWLWTGLWIGLGFLSKYTALILVPCFALFFLLWAPARQHLRRPGPWLALLVLGLCTVPVLLWNAQHGWVTVQHVAENAKLEKAWTPTLRYFGEFLGAECGLLNPVFFVGILWAMARVAKRSRHGAAPRYLFSLGAPVFLGYWAYTLHSRVQPNWIAASAVPLLCLLVVTAHERWAEYGPRWKPWLIGGITVGLLAGILLSDTSLIPRLTGVRLSTKLDPTRRVRGIERMAKLVKAEWEKLTTNGAPVFIITSHYGLAGQLSFYLPEAKAGLPDRPLVYPRYSAEPRNQFYFWPEYHYWKTRPGQDALYVTFHDFEKVRRFPEEVLAQFSSMEDLGTREIKERGQILHLLRFHRLRQLKTDASSL
jgi:membrane-associated phospholipid phosphatase